MRNHFLSVFKFIIGWPLALIALYFIVKLIIPQLPTLLTNLTNINLFLFGIGVCCFVTFYSLKSYTWHLLLKTIGHQLPFRQTCFLWASSEIKRYIPGNVWSFLSRGVLFSEKGVTKKEIAKLFLFEAELLVIGSTIVSLLAVPFILQYHLLPIPVMFIQGSVILFFLFVGFYLFHTKIKKIIFFPSFTPTIIISLITLSAVTFFFFGLAYYFIIISFVFIDPNLIWQLVGFATLSFLLGYLSILTPAGFGVREGILTIGLTKIITEAAAGFVALLTRVIMILSEVLFVFLAFLWHTTKNTYLAKGEHWLKRHKGLSIVIAFFIFFCLYFIPITFLRYDNYYTGKYDLGNMSQTVWNTTQGRIFQLTNPDSARNMSRLSIHADFILVFFAPFYTLWPDPRNLLFFQVITVGAGVFFIYLLSKKILKHPTLAVVLSFAYLINPSVNRVTLYDFHAASLATTFLFGAFYFFQEKRYKLFLLFAILAGLCKEQVWIIVGIFGLFLLVQKGKRFFGALLFLSSFALSYVLISCVIPQALGSEHFAISYYADFGDTTADALKAIVLSPDKVLMTLLQENRLIFLNQIFLPLGYLSFLAPQYLLFIIPDLLLKLLSSNPNFYQIYYQYTAVLTPFIFISAIYGMHFLQKIVGKLPKPYTLNPIPLSIFYILFSAIYSAYLFGPLPGTKNPNLVMVTNPLANRDFVDKALAAIPENASVAASNNLASHLSNRESIYVVPAGIEQADYVAFLQKNLPSQDKLPVEAQLIQQLKNDPAYHLVTEDETFFLFKKWKQ